MDVEAQNEATKAAPVLGRAAQTREEEVHRLADQLLLEGQHPSVERLRGAAGATARGRERHARAVDAVVDHARTLLHETLAQQSPQLAIQAGQLERDRLALNGEREDVQSEQVLRKETLRLAQAQLREANERERLDQLKLNDAQDGQLRSQQQL